MPPTTTAGHDPALHACSDCDAPLEAGQRYCIRCGAPNRTAEDPATRYLAAAAQRRRPLPSAPRRKNGVGLGTAAVLAALPLAVGIGVLAGRSGNDGDLAAALRKQRPTVVNLGGTGTGSAAPTVADAAAASKKGKDAKAGAKVDAAAKKASEAVVGSGVGGKAHSVEHHVSTAATKARDKAVVRRLNKETGKSYVDSQRNLPDVIEVQPDPDAGPPAAQQSAGQP